jgi:putative tryptophan/tyrosine transport system substrate-binding protein
MELDQLKQRSFITLFGGAAAWPLAARAQQQRERMRRIGVLMCATPEDPYQTTYPSAFMRGLQERGWTIGRNVRLDYRWGAGNSDSLSEVCNGISRARAGCYPGDGRSFLI